jgi:hypothetical protein
LGRKILAFLDWVVFGPDDGPLSTTGSTKALRQREIRLPRDPFKYDGRDLSADQLELAEREREEEMLFALWVSDTWAKVL